MKRRKKNQIFVQCWILDGLQTQKPRAVSKNRFKKDTSVIRSDAVVLFLGNMLLNILCLPELKVTLFLILDHHLWLARSFVRLNHYWVHVKLISVALISKETKKIERMAKGASTNYACSCFLVAMINMINAASANGGSCVLPRNATLSILSS